MSHLEDDHTDATASLDLRLWRQLAAYLRPYRKEVVITCVTGVTTAGADALFPLVTRAVIDDVARAQGPVDLWPHALAYLALTALLSLSILSFIRCAGRVRTHVGHDIRRAGFENLQRLSFAYFDRRPVGWLMARMTSDCERLSNILAWGVLDFAWGTALLLSISVSMFVLDARLALLVLGVVPAIGFVSTLFRRRILESARRVRRTNSRITAAYNEGIMAVRTSKVFLREGRNAREFEGLSAEMNRASVRNALQSALYLPVVMTLGSLATGVALAVGGLDVVAGAVSIGTLVAFLTYTRQFFDPIQEMAHWFAEMQMAQASAERVLGLIGTEPEIADSPAVRERIARHAGRGDVAQDGFPDRVGEVEFQDVSFAYERHGPPVLESFTLRVSAGETIALVGPTGGGKTTIVNLLCRFYEPTAGAILLDGVDYRERGLHWLQSNLGIVQQEPHLFSGTVAENIRYGRLEASDAEVVEAARVAGATAFVDVLDEGLATEVGEGGNRLSTGQKQLVSFARAILARPRILVMDEATSSVDTETERRIQHGLARVLEGRTSFVIAHRLSTIRSADRILVIEAGRIVEQGSHRDLLRRRGRYHELYVQQSLRDTLRREEAWIGEG